MSPNFMQLREARRERVPRTLRRGVISSSQLFICILISAVAAVGTLR